MRLIRCAGQAVDSLHVRRPLRAPVRLLLLASQGCDRNSAATDVPRDEF
jgi:hypothetical protein